MNDNEHIDSNVNNTDLATALESKLKVDRDYWMKNISALISTIDDISKLSSTQVTMLSYRQILNDKIIEMQYMIFKKESIYDGLYKTKYLDYLNNSLKTNASEKDKFVKCDLSTTKRHLNILESHISFYKESIKTLDNMAYAIRNKIKLEEDF